MRKHRPCCSIIANLNNAVGLTVSPPRILAVRGSGSSSEVVFFTYAGVQQTSETLTGDLGNTTAAIDYFNDTLLVARVVRRFSLTDLSQIERYDGILSTVTNVAHTRLGAIGKGSSILYIQPYGTTVAADAIQHQLPTEFGHYRKIAHQDDLLYLADRGFTTNILPLRK